MTLQEIAYFSYDDNHDFYAFSDVSLRYYYPPIFDAPGRDKRSPIDLSVSSTCHTSYASYECSSAPRSKGFESFRMRDDTADEHLDGLLETLIEAEKRQGGKIEADVVTWRGMMTKACFFVHNTDTFG